MTPDNSQTSERLTIGVIALLVLAVAVYSLSSFLSKLASGFDFLSIPYLCCFGGVVMVLGVYAFLWQIALKKAPLNKAYLFKSLSLVFGLGIAHFAFQESLTGKNLAGALIVFVGLLVLLSER